MYVFHNQPQKLVSDDSFVRKLQAYDSHCNLVLGEVEETIYTLEETEDDDDEGAVKVSLMVYAQATDSAPIVIRERRRALYDTMSCSMLIAVT